MLSIANAITVDGICYYTCLYIPFKFTATFYGYVLGECFFFLKFRRLDLRIATILTGSPPIYHSNAGNVNYERQLRADCTGSHVASRTKRERVPSFECG